MVCVNMALTKYEIETIITYNREESHADVFTYEKSWQQHIEKRLGIKPILVNEYGGRGYQVPKNRIRMPLAPRPKRRISKEQRKTIGERLKKARARRPVLI